MKRSNPGIANSLSASFSSGISAEDRRMICQDTPYAAEASSNAAVVTSQGGIQLMRSISVLATQRISADDRAKIEASDSAIRLIDAGGWFEGEIRDTWTAFAAARYLPPGATGSGSREERDRLLAEAEVIIGGWPFPLDLRARAPRLKWLINAKPAPAT